MTVYESSLSYLRPPFILYMKTCICCLHWLKKKKEKEGFVDYLLLLELGSAQLQKSEVGDTTWSPGTGVDRTSGWPRLVPAG